MKRLGIITIILVLAVSMTACGKEKDSKEEIKNESRESTVLDLGEVKETKENSPIKVEEPTPTMPVSESDVTAEPPVGNDAEVSLDAFLGNYIDAGENTVTITANGAEIAFLGTATFTGGKISIDGEKLILTFDGSTNPCPARFSFYYTDLGCTLEILEMSFDYLMAGDVYEGFIIQE